VLGDTKAVIGARESAGRPGATGDGTIRRASDAEDAKEAIAASAYPSARSHTVRAAPSARRTRARRQCFRPGALLELLLV